MPSGLKPQYDVYPLTPALRLGLTRLPPTRLITPALRLGLVTVLSELGFSPDSACTELVEAPDIQSACTEPVEVSDNKLVQIIYCQSPTILPLFYLLDGMSKIIFCYHEFRAARDLFTDGITDGH